MNDMTSYMQPDDQQKNYAVQAPAPVVEVTAQPQQPQQLPSQIVAPYVAQQPPQAQPLPPVAAASQAQSQGDATKKSGLSSYSAMAKNFMGDTQPATMPAGQSDPNVTPVREGQKGMEGAQGLAGIVGSFFGLGGGGGGGMMGGMGGGGK